MSTAYTANITLITRGPIDKHPLIELFEKNSFSTTACEPEDLHETTQNNRTDLIIIELPYDDLEQQKSILKTKPSEVFDKIPCLLLCHEENDQIYKIARDIEADDILRPCVEPRKLIARVMTLLRLSALNFEVQHRSHTAQKLKLCPPALDHGAQGQEKPYQIALLSPKDGDKATIETILKSDCHIDVYDDALHLDKKDVCQPYDIIIIHLEEQTQARVLAVIAHLKKTDVPVLILSQETTAHFLEQNHIGVIRTIKRPLKQAAIKIHLTMMVENQRKYVKAVHALNALSHTQAIDANSAAHNQDFFQTYLALQTGSPKKWHPQFSVISVAIKNLETISQDFGPEIVNLVLKQTHLWIKEICPIEYLIARNTDQGFHIAVPNCLPSEAHILMNRIAGVISYSEVNSPTISKPFRLFIAVGLSSIAPYDKIELNT